MGKLEMVLLGIMISCDPILVPACSAPQKVECYTSQDCLDKEHFTGLYCVQNKCSLEDKYEIQTNKDRR